MNLQTRDWEKLLLIKICLDIRYTVVDRMDINNTAIKIGDKLCTLHTIWDGRDSVVEMRDGGFNQWRQMEWIGFYFQ